MRWFVLLVLGIASLAHASEARACSCMKLTPAEGLSSSDAVFSGEVTQIEKNEATRFGGLEVTLRVKEVWKGAPAEEIKVHTAGNSAACGYPFAVGTTYLVYALNDEADPMRVSLCSRTAPHRERERGPRLPRQAIESVRQRDSPEEQRKQGRLQRRSRFNRG